MSYESTTEPALSRPPRSDASSPVFRRGPAGRSAGPRLPAEPVLQGEELRAEGGQRLAKLVELGFGPVDFESGDAGNLECFLQQGADVLQMPEQPAAFTYPSRQCAVWPSKEKP